MKHAGPLALACGMLLASSAGAAPNGGANEIWVDDSGSLESLSLDPTARSLDWQVLGSTEPDNGAWAENPLGATDPLLTPTLDRFIQSLEQPVVDGSHVPGGSMPYGTALGPMDPSSAAGGGIAGKGKDKDKDKGPPPGPVPEPSTLLLAGASALAVGGRKRFQAWRRKRQENVADM